MESGGCVMMLHAGRMDRIDAAGSCSPSPSLETPCARSKADAPANEGRLVRTLSVKWARRRATLRESSTSEHFIHDACSTTPEDEAPPSGLRPARSRPPSPRPSAVPTAERQPFPRRQDVSFPSCSPSQDDSPVVLVAGVVRGLARGVVVLELVVGTTSGCVVVVVTTAAAEVVVGTMGAILDDVAMAAALVEVDSAAVSGVVLAVPSKPSSKPCRRSRWNRVGGC